MKLAKLIFIPMTALLLSGCLPGGGGEKKDPTYDPSATEVKKDSYYDTSKFNLNGTQGAALQFELHKLMLATHHTLIKYSQFATYVKPNANRNTSVDQVSASVEKNEFFYTGKQTEYKTSFTKEHVWPCAKSGGMWVHKNYTDPKYYVDGTNYVGGGSDLYHIRPCTSKVNTARGDSRFKEFSEAEKQKAVVMGDGGPYSLLCTASEFSQYSEPADQMKGDVARILVYVYIHYSRMGDVNWDDYCGSLSLRDVIGYDDDNKVYETLVRWNELDPVSETEIFRNNNVQKIQGNRNPFVDYPFLMRKCFGL